MGSEMCIRDRLPTHPRRTVETRAPSRRLNDPTHPQTATDPASPDPSRPDILATVPPNPGDDHAGLRLLPVRHEALHDRVEVKGLCRLASRSWPVKLRAAGTRERAGWRKRP